MKLLRIEQEIILQPVYDKFPKTAQFITPFVPFPLPTFTVNNKPVTGQSFITYWADNPGLGGSANIGNFKQRWSWVSLEVLPLWVKFYSNGGIDAVKNLKFE